MITIACWCGTMFQTDDLTAHCPNCDRPVYHDGYLPESHYTIQPDGNIGYISPLRGEEEKNQLVVAATLLALLNAQTSATVIWLMVFNHT